MLKNKKIKNEKNIEYGQPLTFSKKKKIWLEERTSEKKEILHFCCKKMKDACTEYNKHRYSDKSDRGGTNYHSSVYRPEGNVGCYTHYYDDCYDASEHMVNWMVFRFCPWCGMRINGTISEMEDLR